METEKEEEENLHRTSGVRVSFSAYVQHIVEGAEEEVDRLDPLRDSNWSVESLR